MPQGVKQKRKGNKGEEGPKRASRHLLPKKGKKRSVSFELESTLPLPLQRYASVLTRRVPAAARVGYVRPQAPVEHRDADGYWCATDSVDLHASAAL